MRLDTLVTAPDIQRLLPTVSRHLVYLWRSQGRLRTYGRRGRSPLYRWGDILTVERATALADPASQRRTVRREVQA